MISLYNSARSIMPSTSLRRGEILCERSVNAVTNQVLILRKLDNKLLTTLACPECLRNTLIGSTEIIMKPHSMFAVVAGVR